MFGSEANFSLYTMATGNADYEFQEIEKFWQDKWQDDKTFRAEDFSSKEKYYILDMFPYPSGAGLHIGHPEGYTASDILARYKRAKGFNVLHPMGWDAFGLPAEQYAVKTGTHPAVTTAKNIENFRKQIKAIGFAIDWDREINTTDPHYFKWTQWIFLQLFKKGLAYVDKKPVWWCPNLATVLANEEVIDGRSEVGNHPVERRNLRQWVLRITAYADKLIDGLKDLDWPDSTKRLQENWIGRSEGALADFALEGFENETLKIFTTRPDTLYGVTYMVISPEHPLVSKLTTKENAAAVEEYVKKSSSKSDLDRTDLAKDKTGVFTGSYAINPLNGARIPVWIADYVLMSYGTGAIMAVPAHDERDYEFAVKYNIPVIRVIDKKDAEGKDIPLPFTDVGLMTNSAEWDGTPSDIGKKKITELLEARKIGAKSVNYKLRDWLFSRQRYWGEPFPIVWVDKAAYEAAKNGALKEQLPALPVCYADDDGVEFYALPLPYASLPLELPKLESYQPSGTGESPLANALDWVQIWINPLNGETASATLPKPAEGWVKAKRETNTMPQWAGSCWYYLRYCDPKCATAPISKENEKYWGAPDFYIGGAEHAVLHLLYARFWHKVLYDCGFVTSSEPFKKLFHQGIILGQLEFTAFKDAQGNFVSAKSNTEGLAAIKLAEDEVEKTQAGYVLKSDKSISVDARSFKMSKSRGNVVNPDDIIREYGSDSLRLYEMFLGPLEDQKPWSSSGIEGVFRFLRKVWREYIGKDGKLSEKIVKDYGDSPEILKALHETIKKVSADIEGLRFNTAISQMMIFISALQKVEKFSLESAEKFIKILAPLAPHIAEEIWNRLGHKTSISAAQWPLWDESLIATDDAKIVVQINGKLRAELSMKKSDSKESVIAAAKAHEKIIPHIEGKTILKEIFVPGKIVNLVVK